MMPNSPRVERKRKNLEIVISAPLDGSKHFALSSLSDVHSNFREISIKSHVLVGVMRDSIIRCCSFLSVSQDEMVDYSTATPLELS